MQFHIQDHSQMEKYKLVGSDGGSVINDSVTRVTKEEFDGNLVNRSNPNDVQIRMSFCSKYTVRH